MRLVLHKGEQYSKVDLTKVKQGVLLACIAIDEVFLNIRRIHTTCMHAHLCKMHCKVQYYKIAYLPNYRHLPIYKHLQQKVFIASTYVHRIACRLSELVSSPERSNSFSAILCLSTSICFICLGNASFIGKGSANYSYMLDVFHICMYQYCKTAITSSLIVSYNT